MQHAMVGQGQGRLAQPSRFFGQFVGTAQAVEQGVFAVYVEVNKVVHELSLV
ncbi:MAG: hypothetical protein HYR94_11825 [Chloroflexi bacterium]|nr:hypothetical protein [Chloroflexota bacterium]